MQFGIAVATAADSWRLVQRAEAHGFSHAWFYDTQMLSADCFVAMAAAAMKTSRIRLGTGVLVPSNRIAPVTANALASLNALAPGRIDFGVGTGFTARRAMGMGAMRLSDMEHYINAVMGLLAGERVEAMVEGAPRKLEFLNPELGLINLTDPIALHVSAYGPKARALTARLGAGWLNFVGDVTSGAEAMRAMASTWRDAGHVDSALHATAFALGCVLAPGEPHDSERAMAQAGPRAAVLLHRSADAALAGLPNTSTIPPSVADTVAAYIEHARCFEPADTRYMDNHRGHLMVVKDEERKFVTSELIRTTSFTGEEQDLVSRIGALGEAGYTQFTIQIPPGCDDAIDDWARIQLALT